MERVSRKTLRLGELTLIYDLEYFLKFDRPFKRPIDWPTELMYPVALWLFHKPSKRRRQIYSLIGHLVCLPARYRTWERRIVTYRSSERIP